MNLNKFDNLLIVSKYEESFIAFEKVFFEYEIIILDFFG